MKKITVKVKRKAGYRDLPLPEYMSSGASGMDLLAAVAEEVVLPPGEIKLIPNGLFISLPPGYEAQIRPRSGLALKQGISIVNSPGTIDSDYRGELAVIMINLGKKPVLIKRGMRVAQLVIQEVVRGEVREVEELDATNRAGGGFGHTGH